MKPINLLALFVFILTSTPIFADGDAPNVEKLPNLSLSNLSCKSHYNSSSNRVGFTRSWLTCSSRDNKNYLLLGHAPDGSVVTRFEYQAQGGHVNLSVDYSGEYGELNVEQVSGTVILDAIYSGVEEERSAAGAQLALSTLKCIDAPTAESTGSAFWSTTSGSNQASPSESIRAFYQDPAVDGTTELVRKLSSELAKDGLLTEVSLPVNWKSSSEFGSIESSLLSFGVLQDSFDSQPQPQGIGDCVLLALGATGAIIGAINSNPELGAACSGSCGGALACLATLAGGGSAGTGCGVATGTCLYCVGVGYSTNLNNCFRHFVEER